MSNKTDFISYNNIIKSFTNKSKSKNLYRNFSKFYKKLKHAQHRLWVDKVMGKWRYSHNVNVCDHGENAIITI